ncbi:KRI1-like family C-terminal-domain-containing protein [Trametes gibbosa]|nr:KRI1-like family C-terminal-domain-containing protein [Trametes gibbosa]
MFSDDSDVEENHTLTVNEHYARAFEYRKEREELAKLKEKYGSDLDEDDDEDEDSEEGVTEDEDGEELTPAVDAAILRTLARIKRKDPDIYESGKDIFEEERERTRDAKLIKRSAKDKSKPLTLRQHAIASALDDGASRSPSPQPLTHFEEQEKLRSETIAAFHASAAAKDEEEDFLVPREKTKDEIEREAEEYRAYLQREVGEDLSGLVTVDEDVAGVLDGDNGTDDGWRTKKVKRETKEKQTGKNKQEEDQEFLMNYILNRGWIDKSARRMPTYKEITGGKQGEGKSVADSESDDGESQGEGEHLLSDDDTFDEVAERFESSYNFRFEEPGAGQITRYPRTLPELVRRQDTARKEAREKKKARKEEELLKKKEEVKRLKALKLKELRAKLERIGQEGGKRLEDSEALQELDLEGEWDPSKHDEQMSKIYANDEVVEDDFEDDEKPQWDDDIDIGDIPIPDDDGFYGDTDADGASKKKKKKKKKKKGTEDDMDEGGVDVADMDAAVERPPANDDDDDEEWDGTEEMRRRKLEEYMDEVYGLDFNDMVAGMPTRFKYAKVESQNFGLTPAEILMATDAELNSYMGVKKIAPYRKEGKGRNWDSRRTERLHELKSKLKERGIGGSVQSSAAAQEKKKRKGKKERLRSKAGIDGQDGGVVEEDERGDEGDDADVPTKRGHKRGSKEVEEPHEGDEASGKKRRRKHKKSSAAVVA